MTTETTNATEPTPSLPELVGMPNVRIGDTVWLPGADTKFDVVHIKDDGTAVLRRREGEGHE